MSSTGTNVHCDIFKCLHVFSPTISSILKDIQLTMIESFWMENYNNQNNCQLFFYLSTNCLSSFIHLLQYLTTYVRVHKIIKHPNDSQMSPSRNIGPRLTRGSIRG